VGNIGRQGLGNPKGQQQTSRISSPLETETETGRGGVRLAMNYKGTRDFQMTPVIIKKTMVGR